MKYLTGAVIAYATVLIWRRWSRPWLQWLFSRGDVPPGLGPSANIE